MSDLIERQAVIESIRECAEAAHSMGEWDMEQGYLNAIECIEEEPSAQPIIRCKDCVHNFEGLFHCDRVTFYNEKDDFCSKAKRTSL